VTRPTMALVGCTMALAGCAVDDGTLLGMDGAGTEVELAVDLDDGSYRFKRDGSEFRGDATLEAGGAFDGYLRLDNAWGVMLDDRHVVSALPGVEGPDVLWAAGTRIDPRWEVLMRGQHTCLNLDEQLPTGQAYAYLTLTADRWFLRWVSEEAPTPDSLGWGENQVAEADADLDGSWAFGDDGNRVTLSGVDGDWTGYTWPGFAMALRNPSGAGMLACFWSPVAHNQLSVYDGFHRYMEWRRDGDRFVGPTPAVAEIFGDEGTFTRLVDGEEETGSLGVRSPAFMVGNIVSWIHRDEEQIFQIYQDHFVGHFSVARCQQGPPQGPNGPSAPRGPSPGDDDSAGDDDAGDDDSGAGPGDDDTGPGPGDDDTGPGPGDDDSGPPPGGDCPGLPDGILAFGIGAHTR
jgi:hypothetical protein